MKINLGIIGCGAITEYCYLPALINNKLFDLICLIDKNFDQINFITKRYKYSSL